jgi:hypothetical protein
MDDPPNIWIGSLENEGIVLYDPQAQDPKDCDRAILWLSSRECFERYYKSMVKTYLTTENDPAVRTSTFVKYRNFRARELEMSHRKRIEKLGFRYAGLKPTAKSHRVTHCYVCKDSLDSSVDVECVNCGWIVCRCGACGCGFEHPNRS